MENNSYLGHSGGAVGSDTQWDIIGKEYGFNTVKHYYFDGFKTPNGNSPITLSDELKSQIDLIIQKANKTLKRSYPTRSEYVNNLLRRNWFQVYNSESIYAISTVTNNLVDGGTGWAVQMAIDCRKRVYVFCQNRKKWLTWKLGVWEECETPRLSNNFACIGTREIDENGINAIRAVYKKTSDYEISKNSDNFH